MRLFILGTGHVLDVAEAVRAVIRAERPKIVALELDSDRYQGLLQRRSTGRTPRPPPEAGRVYRYLARFQESMGDAFGVQPGTEMLVAADAAQEVGAQVALIDLNAQAFVAQAMKRMTWREKGKLLWSSLAAAFPRRGTRHVEAELKRYQADPERYLDDLGREYPTMRRTLIDERDDHMAARLREIAPTEGAVVAVVGDGHVPGLVRRLKDLGPLVYRLKDLRGRVGAGPVQWRMSGPGEVGFSFEGRSLEGALRRGPP